MLCVAERSALPPKWNLTSSALIFLKSDAGSFPMNRPGWKYSSVHEGHGDGGLSPGIVSPKDSNGSRKGTKIVSFSFRSKLELMPPRLRGGALRFQHIGFFFIQCGHQISRGFLHIGSLVVSQWD